MNEFSVSSRSQNILELDDKPNKSPRNKTISINADEKIRYEKRILQQIPPSITQLTDIIVNADLFASLQNLPREFADLIIIDPPYNLDKNFHGNTFSERTNEEYTEYVESWLPTILSCAKKNASIYICCDWKASAAIFSVLEKHTIIRNRITWQREKGRGAKHNWKNCSEDIWYATKGKDFYFDVTAVMQRKKVIAPYRENGKPKDWIETKNGKYRLTYPSNFWGDITIPYWSMSENTEHPTQKPEKLIAKLILASSEPNTLVFDPFAGSGTTAVVAKKLKRHFFCIEHNFNYCLWAEKRLELADKNASIQGYSDGVFGERNEGG